VSAGSAAYRVAAAPPGTPAAHSCHAPRTHGSPHNAVVQGLEVSRNDVLQHKLLQAQLRDQPFQFRVLLLQLLQPPRLVHLCATCQRFRGTIVISKERLGNKTTGSSFGKHSSVRIHTEQCSILDRQRQGCTRFSLRKSDAYHIVQYQRRLGSGEILSLFFKQCKPSKEFLLCLNRPINLGIQVGS